MTHAHGGGRVRGSSSNTDHVTNVFTPTLADRRLVRSTTREKNTSSNSNGSGRGGGLSCNIASMAQQRGHTTGRGNDSADGGKGSPMGVTRAHARPAAIPGNTSPLKLVPVSTALAKEVRRQRAQGGLTSRETIPTTVVPVDAHDGAHIPGKPRARAHTSGEDDVVVVVPAGRQVEEPGGTMLLSMAASAGVPSSGGDAQTKVQVHAQAHGQGGRTVKKRRNLGWGAPGGRRISSNKADGSGSGGAGGGATGRVKLFVPEYGRGK